MAQMAQNTNVDRHELWVNTVQVNHLVRFSHFELHDIGSAVDGGKEKQFHELCSRGKARRCVAN